MSEETPPNVVKLKLLSVGENYVFDHAEVLDAAKEHKFTKFVIIGQYADDDKNDEEGLYIASPSPIPETLMLLEIAKLQCLGR